MNAQLFLNNFDSQFIAAVKSTPTTGTPASELDYGIVRLPQSAGAVLGTLTNGDYYILTAFKRSGSNETSVEIMKVTSVDTSVINETRLTVLRGQEGTDPQAYISGDYISLRETAAGLSGMLQKSGNLAGLADALTARTNLGLGNVNNTSDANKPVSTAQQAALDTKAPLANPAFTGGISTPGVNGGPASGFKNKIINGCVRISKKGTGAAALGINAFGADGISTYIGGWSAVTGTISGEYQESSNTRTSSGATHFVNLAAATGSVGYITYIARIEAADALELAGKTVTASARITSWTKQIDDVLINIYKANTFNNFSSPTLIANVAGLGPVAANTSKDVSFSPTLNGADCVNGLQVEFLYYYSSAVAAAFQCFIADLQLCIGLRRMPFEPRPIAIEEMLRERYYRKHSLWISTSSGRTQIPIRMMKTPTITGGGAGYNSTGTDKDTLICYQTTAAQQTIILDAELA